MNDEFLRIAKLAKDNDITLIFQQPGVGVSGQPIGVVLVKQADTLDHIEAEINAQINNVAFKL